MVNYKLMNDMFINKDILSTKELLAIGLTSNDLTKLIKNGNLKKNGRGFYSLPIPDRELIYPLVNIIERITSGETLIMLEPLSKEEATTVLETIANIPGIKSFVVEEDKVRIFLRRTVNSNLASAEPDLIARASCLYDAEFYDGYIDVMETVLPSMANPSSDIYLHLSFSYQQLIAKDVSNATKMIDYLTLAVHTKDDDKGKLLLNFMREKYKYNGIKIKDDIPLAESLGQNSVQYKFNFES